MSISQQQQQRWQQSLENSRPRVSSPPQARASAPALVPATSPKPKKPPSSQNATPPPKAPEPPAKAEEPVWETNNGGEFGLNFMTCICSASLQCDNGLAERRAESYAYLWYWDLSNSACWVFKTQDQTLVALALRRFGCSVGQLISSWSEFFHRKIHYSEFFIFQQALLGL